MVGRLERMIVSKRYGMTKAGRERPKKMGELGFSLRTGGLVVCNENGGLRQKDGGVTVNLEALESCVLVL